MNEIKFLPCGDSAFTVEFAREINEEINKKIRYLSDSLKKNPVKGIFECVPTFRSVTVYFDSTKVSFSHLENKIKKIMDGYKQTNSVSKKVFIIPVCYDDEFSPDMADVCQHTKLTKQQVIDIHSGRDYLIYMLGFLPGFPYLGGMDERIATPRLDSPRTAIPMGAVGIGGEQTGIYPLTSPGGWRLIGQTPVRPYDPNRAEPILYQAGNYIRFKPISKEEYDILAKQEENGELTVEIEEVKS